jgi:hypothetical protein
VTPGAAHLPPARRLALAAGVAAWLAFSPVTWPHVARRHSAARSHDVSRRAAQLSRATRWRLVSATPVNFNAHHPQGMVKIGGALFVSSVEVRTPTKRFAQPVDGYDRTPGAGTGHLFKLDLRGNLLADVKLGEGTIYHPGGIDWDGQFIWAPVAEYRPDSRSIVYRVNPATMQATEVFRYNDHIGALVHDTRDRALHGVSWGSRYFYRWPLDRWGRVTNATTPPARLRRVNRSFYVDYQDCHYLGRREMLCGGLGVYRLKKDGPEFRLGGLELVDLRTGRAKHQTPVELWTESGLPMTHNPFWVEATPGGLRAYFMPEDERSTLYVYEADLLNS